LQLATHFPLSNVVSKNQDWQNPKMGFWTILPYKLAACNSFSIAQFVEQALNCLMKNAMACAKAFLSG